MHKFFLVFSFIFVMLFLPFEVIAQTPSPTEEIQDTLPRVKMSPVKISRVSEKLTKSLDKNDETEIAKNYEALAQEFIDKNDYEIAEKYLTKSLESYTKLKSTDNITRISRRLAKLQESQKNYTKAIKNYDLAGENSKEISIQQINLNDANRLRSGSNVEAQSDYIQSNIDLLEEEVETEEKEEVIDAYVQKAEINLKLKKKSSAIESYNKALSYSKDEPREAIKINSKIAEVYLSENQFDEAILINTKLLNEAKENNDFNTEIEQLDALSEIYFKKGDPEKAISALTSAYELAIEKGETFGAKNSLSQLLDYYKTNGQDKESILLYEDFFNKLNHLIASDSSLVETKLFEVTEKKIEQLEKEKALKDELIYKKNVFNYFLIGAISLLLLLFYFIIKALNNNKTKSKKIALQSLRREMNPHFIFNSLNSVNQFISQNKELEANKYLTSYSNLMRNTMENSNKDFIALSNEIEQLTKYLELEHMRFQDKFDFEISVDDDLNTETTFVPNMIIQPHLENAIWHGLRYRKDKGLLQLKFGLKNGKASIIIDDNGIGLQESKALKTKNQKVHQSRGLTNTKERIELLNKLYKKNITFEIKDKTTPKTGVIIEIIFPLIHKLG